jgi:DNA adenine methylase
MTANPKAPRITPPLKWHGGKSYLAGRIVALMPRHLHYVEPYAGGLAVLLARDPGERRLWKADAPAKFRGVSEVANDLHRDLTNFWRVLQDVDAFARLHRTLQAVPFSEVEWQDARDGLLRCPEADPVRRAAWFFVLNRQSLAGRMDAFTGITRTRTRGDRNAEVNAWWNAIDGLPAVHRRLRDVLVLNRPALDLIRGHDGPDTLFYLDPPYLHQTRAATDVYGPHEMSEADHRELLGVLLGCRGKVMLSGYPNDLYDRALAGWTRHTRDIANHAAGGRKKGRETEELWCNF